MGEANWTTQAPKTWQLPSIPGPSHPIAPSRVGKPTHIARTRDSSHRDNQEFILVKWYNRRKKGRNQADPSDPTSSQSSWINLTPGTYARVATAAVNVQQNTTLPQIKNMLPSITEIIVLHYGRHIDHQVEQGIRARAADAIICEVRLNMAKVVANPIPLQAGK